MGVKQPPTGEHDIWLSAVRTYAVTEISKGRTKIETQKHFIKDQDAAEGHPINVRMGGSTRVES